MPDLLNFETRSGSSIKIVEKIGSNYSKLGPLLLCDDDNSVTSAIVDEHRQNAEAINQEFMTRWLQGRGKKPVAWSTLICVLRDIGLSELAQRIEENLVPCQMQNKIKALMEENDELKQKLENCKQQLHEKVLHLTCMCIERFICGRLSCGYSIIHCMTEYDLLWRIFSGISWWTSCYTPDVHHVTPTVHQKYTNSLEH